MALIDAEGVGQLTMRRLGSALGVEAIALYRYSRQVLLNALVDSMVSQMSTDPGMQMLPGDEWRDYLDRLAHGVRQMTRLNATEWPAPTRACRALILPIIGVLSWLA